MDRIVGVETEYGCLLSEDESHVNSELWPAKVKNYLFRKADAGTIDLHYRDYEEPPGNGGFLLNGGRLYLDMGHIEYASPECLHLHDLVTYELAGDELLQSALVALGAAGVGLWTAAANGTRAAFVALAAAVTVQYALGVATVLFVVPVGA